MAFESLTDDKILDLVKCPKQCTNPQVGKKVVNGTEQVNYKAVSTDGNKYHFNIYIRQNLRENMQDDFSCGIAWVAPSGQTLTLKRYNGSSHRHKNHLEGNQLSYTCHIHFATEKYIRNNRKADGFAQATDRYRTLAEAFRCLIADCNLSGIPPVQIQLF